MKSDGIEIMLFFPEDFNTKLIGKEIDWQSAWQDMADIANAKMKMLVDQGFIEVQLNKELSEKLNENDFKKEE